MSVRATNFVRQLRGLSPEEKAVAFVLADHDSHKGNGAYPSMTTVAQEAGLKNRETASRITKRLVQKQIFLPNEPTTREQGRPTVYHPNYGAGTCDSPVTGGNELTCDSPVTPPLIQPVTLNCKPVTLEGQTCDSPVTQRVEGRRGEAVRKENPVQHPNLLELTAKKNSHPPPPWAKGELRETLWRGIYFQKVSDTFFDSRHLKPTDRLKGCIAVAVTTLFTARVATLKSLNPNEVERRVLAEMLRHGADKTLELLKDFETRQRQTVQTITRAVIEVCTEMLNGVEHATA